MTKNNFKKVAVPWIVSWKFSVISKISFIWKQLYFKVGDHDLLSCVLRTMRFVSLAYIATPKKFEIILSALYVWQEIVLLAIVP